MLQAAVIVLTVFNVVVQSAPTIPTTSLPPTATLRVAAAADTETISLEGLDYLLKRAEQLFRSPEFTSNNQDGIRIHEKPYLKLKPPTEEPYNFYLPVFTTYDNDHNIHHEKIDQNSKNLLKFSPPGKNLHEHNYYAAKPKKIPKKFSSAVKHVNINTPASNLDYNNNEWEALYNFNNNNRRNHYADDDSQTNQNQHKIIFDDSYFGIDSHIQVPEETSQQTPQTENSKTILTIKPSQRLISRHIEDTESTEPEDDTSTDDEREDGEKDLPTIIPKEQDQRMEYQMHGFDGPKSYKFGYDTGKGKDRQYRFEERNRDGNVKGQYGYIDKNGKMNVVKYLSSVGNGFRIVN